MRITLLPDVEQRPRRVAVGEFDGVHLGHRAVIQGSDTVLTFEPHPLAVIKPEAAPKLLTTLERKAQLVAELGVAGAGRDPVRRGIRAAQRRGLRRPRARRDAAGDARLGRGELPLRPPRAAATRHCCARTSASRRASCRSWRPRARSSPPRTSAASCWRARWTSPSASSARRSRWRARSSRATDAGASSASRPRTSCPIPALIQPGHGIYAARASFGDEARIAAVNVGVRPTFKTDLVVLVEAYLLDWDGDLYGQRLTLEYVARLRGERRFELGRGADRPDARGRRRHARDLRRLSSPRRRRSATVPRR